MAYLRVQVLAFHTQVSIDDVKAHQQAHDHCSLLLQHKSRILIEITEEARDDIICYPQRPEQSIGNVSL